MVMEKLISCMLLFIVCCLICVYVNCYVFIFLLFSLWFIVIKIYVVLSNLSINVVLEMKRIVLIFKLWLYIYINKNIVLFEVMNWMFLECKFVDMFFFSMWSGGIENSCKSGYKEKSNVYVVFVVMVIKSGC